MSSEKKITRRQFLTSSTKAAVGIVAAGSAVSYAGAKAATNSKVRGANERINMAVIGVHNQGGYHLQCYPKIKNVCVRTIVDVDENLFAGKVESVKQLQGFAPLTEYDMRRVFDDKDIDAVSIATPDHWHALAAIWACQAGKDVYVEKPCCHTVWEGRKMIEAAKKYDRIMAVGLQNRSLQNVRQAVKLLHEGIIGDVYMSRVICLKPRPDIGYFPDGPAPDDDKEYPLYGYPGDSMRPFSSSYLNKVHYDMWLGPASKTPFNRNRFHYNWHWHWDYGSGEIGNTSPHALDIAAWGLNKTEHPSRITSAGGYFVYDSMQQTPNTQCSTFTYADGKILESEVRGVYTNTEENMQIGNFFYGSKGWLMLDGFGTGWKTFMGGDNTPGLSSENTDVEINPLILTGTGADAHFENFINAVRSHKKEALSCSIDTGFFGNTLPHLANISYRLGRDMKFDGAKEKFIDDEEADAMLTKQYRAPYVVPENV